MRSLLAQIGLVAIACLFWQQASLAQGWERTFGFPASDGLSDVLPTPDGGYVTVGATQALSGPDRQVFLIQTDADGATVWSSTFGDGMKQEFAKSIVTDGSGGYVIGGTSISDGISYAFLARTDQFGNQLWQTSVSVLESNAERATLAYQARAIARALGKAWLKSARQARYPIPPGRQPN